MRFSFESPICMLEDSLKYNDYEYALVHLFDEHPEYLEFYKKQILTRTMYLDNSAYELGESFDPDKFTQYCLDFAAINIDNLYIFLPDYPGDSDLTLQSAKGFPEISYRDKRAKRIGVVHGKSYREIYDCAREMSCVADMIAIPMLAEGFEGAEGLQGRTEARQLLVHHIMRAQEMNLINDVPVHILGCLLPQEFKAYIGLNIYSADTSNPILHGIEGIKYKLNGLQEKSKTRMSDIMTYQVQDEQKKNILHNLEYFFKINKVHGDWNIKLN